MMWDGAGGMAGWGLLMWILSLVFLGLIVVGIFLIVRAAAPTSRPSVLPPGLEGGGLGAHQILDERFARGEIDEEEYRRRKEALRESGGP